MRNGRDRPARSIACLLIIPGDVRTQLNNVELTLGSPDARRFAQVNAGPRAPEQSKRGG
ncbi:hypothetical protein F5Y04DRAFT_221663 [Hypomontagnella monticulosa]|nr:hypothetical protein F5Y04DRAFT_221663 [Hypomontagnella monticulosa]